MKILMTGGRGFVAPHLMAECQNAGHQVRALTLDELDICDRERLKRILQEERPEAFVHLAALSGYDQCLADPERTWQVNTLAVEGLARSLSEVCPGSVLLFTSSGKIYAPQKEAIEETDALLPADFYALTKMSADIRLQQLVSELNITLMNVRAFNHTGPGQRQGFLCPDLIYRLKQQDVGDGAYQLQLGSLSSPVDLTDVRDVARAYRLLLEKPENGCFNVGQGSSITVQDVVNAFEVVTGHQIEAHEKSDWIRSYSETKRSSNIDKIKSHCGWEPQISLIETLKEMWLHH